VDTTSMTSRTEYCTQTPNKPSLFDVQYLRNHRTLDIGVLGYIGIVWPKEHSPEVRSFPPGTPCIVKVEVELHSFLTWTLGGGEWSVNFTSLSLYSGEGTPARSNRCLGGPQSPPGCFEEEHNLLTLLINKTLIFQPLAFSLYRTRYLACLHCYSNKWHNSIQSLSF